MDGDRVDMEYRRRDHRGEPRCGQNLTAFARSALSHAVLQLSQILCGRNPALALQVRGRSALCSIGRLLF